MNTMYVTSYALITVCIASSCRMGSHVGSVCSHPTHGASPVSAPEESARLQNEGVIYDDLSWLVGKWRCVNTRSKEVAAPDADRAAAAMQRLARLEEFNVYYPFDSISPTLELPRIPSRRIAAEMLYRADDGLLMPIDFPCYIHIGIDSIAFCALNGFVFRYRYVFNEGDGSERLEMWSDYAMYLFEKVSDHAGEMSASSIYTTPMTQYWLKLGQHRYRQLTFQLMNRRCNRGGTH